MVYRYRPSIFKMEWYLTINDWRILHVFKYHISYFETPLRPLVKSSKTNVLFCYYQGQIEDYCYDESATIWGSFNPVLSPSSHRVYRNQMCAECHEVYDSVPFDKVLVCKLYKSTGIKSFDEVLIEAYSDFINSGCSVIFFLPKQAKQMDLRPIVCFPKLISTYNYSKLPPKDYRTEVCEKGPLMPYFKHTWFRNFYCSKDDIPLALCADTGFYVDSFEGRAGRSMVILFGENLRSMNRSTVANQVHQEACLFINNTKVGRFASFV